MYAKYPRLPKNEKGALFGLLETIKGIQTPQ